MIVLSTICGLVLGWLLQEVALVTLTTTRITHAYILHGPSCHVTGLNRSQTAGFKRKAQAQMSNAMHLSDTLGFSWQCNAFYGVCFLLFFNRHQGTKECVITTRQNAIKQTVGRLNSWLPQCHDPVALYHKLTDEK